ncbi:mechanosensitive ion channel [Parvibaculum sedimenti]|uniref:Small-conductance mechanosensitive channel n=1 Tax=Parvibaculum sedimenti TaxID=2608632 RepID=A0A6N6VIE6_9HYPH|nr:mechanosensitive ion channel family protein [Parvibaculum sedimenti]KAB7739526.1 mechanosensitive ion channel [Parvibaculum sedimenti]
MIVTFAIIAASLALLRFWTLGWFLAVLPDSMAAFAVDSLGILLSLVLSLLADRLFRYFYWNRIFRRKKGRKAPALVRDLTTAIFLAIGLSTGLYLEVGVAASGIAAASGATAVILGFALQTMIQDLFGGLSINLDRSYAIGDWVTIHAADLGAADYGRVEGIAWRTTFIRLNDGRRLIIPNRLVTSNPITNHSRPDGAKRLTVEICLDMRVPSERAVNILMGEAVKAARARGLSQHPAPSVLVDRIDQDSVYYSVRFYFYPDRISPDEAQSIMLRAAQDAIRKTALPTPVQQVELTQPPVTEVPFAQEARQAIRRVPLFVRALSAEQQGDIAARCRLVILPAGNTLIRQNDTGGSMFVILDGAADVTVKGIDGGEQQVNVLALDDIVGEMSLLTGAPRTATVKAATPLRVLEITKEAIEALLPDAPELLVQFSQILAERQVQLAEASNRTVHKKAVEQDLLSKMRDFFVRSFSAGD